MKMLPSRTMLAVMTRITMRPLSRLIIITLCGLGSVVRQILGKYAGSQRDKTMGRDSAGDGCIILYISC